MGLSGVFALPFTGNQKTSVTEWFERLCSSSLIAGGVELAVAPTKATSQFDWSEKSDSQFRNKIDAISKINHKNFVNILGYCQEDDPFMRMMVFEYAPNGTLIEHLHVKEFGHLDWSTRMKIVMGIAYCLQYMHDLIPAIVHLILQTSCIFITDDYAANIADFGIFSELIEKDFVNDNKDSSVAVLTIHPENNVYSFGNLLLEIISRRMPISKDADMNSNKLDEILETMKSPKLEGKYSSEDLKLMTTITLKHGRDLM